jgi:nitrite reductase (NO-forming)
MSFTTLTPRRLARQPAGGELLAGWRGTVVRLAFGLVFALDAVMKWLPGYRHTFISQLQQTAQGQPAFLHGWFHFWISVNEQSPMLFADLTGLAETTLAIVLLFGVARRAGYLIGAGYMLMVWAIGEGFGGPYVSGSTDVGAGIVYVILFAGLLAFAPAARDERLSLASTATWSRACPGGATSPSRMPPTATRRPPSRFRRRRDLVAA